MFLLLLLGMLELSRCLRNSFSSGAEYVPQVYVASVFEMLKFQFLKNQFNV